ncbi:hypoxanthine phosphoribosyltransferase [Chloroflexota bacterium]
MNAEPGLHILFTKEKIEATVDRLATEISRDYHDKNPLLIGILKGSFLFLADLIRHLDFPLEVDFIRLSSYGKGRETSGKVKVVQGIKSPIQGREVLIIEDIVDTGLTISFLLNHLREKKPASLKICTLTDKPSRRQVPVAIDYLGLTAPDKFLVGYGLDCNEKFRNLPEIYFLEEN